MPLTAQQMLILEDGGCVRLRQTDRYADFFLTADISETPADRCPAFALDELLRAKQLQCVAARQGVRIWRLLKTPAEQRPSPRPAARPQRSPRRAAPSALAVIGEDIGWA